jgi:hypothetical protein
LDPIESNVVRDDMERLYQVSVQAVQQLADLASRVADDAMRRRAEHAREALARARDESAEALRLQRSDRDAAAAVWDTRLRDRHWFGDAPAEEIMQTWVEAQAWADIADPRGIAAVEAFRLRVTHLGIDADEVRRAVHARDLAAFTQQLDTAEDDPSSRLGDDPSRTGAGPDRDPPGQDQSEGEGAARRSRRQVAHGRGGFGQAQLAEMSELISSSMHPDTAAGILQDPNWPRVAGQLFRARGKIDAFNRDHPDDPIDLARKLAELQSSRPSDQIRTPAGWMIWNLHNATASRGVQLIAQTHPHGNTVRGGTDRGSERD